MIIKLIILKLYQVYNSIYNIVFIQIVKCILFLTDIEVTGLTPGKEYLFRVAAVNAEGESKPLEAEQTIVAKNPFGMSNKYHISIPCTIHKLSLKINHEIELKTNVKINVNCNIIFLIRSN